MKIAVTGATGSLGRSLAEFLLTQNMTVVALGRNQEIGALLQAQGAIFKMGDICDGNYLKEAFSGCDRVVHSAGLASPWGLWPDFYRANVQGTESVLKAMQSLQIKNLIHISTPSLYFSGSPRELVKESDPLPEPKSHYARSKGLADQLVFAAVEKQKINAILFRPRSIFGPYDQVIFPRIIKVMKRGFFPLPSGGLSLLDLTAADNIVHAIWLGINSIDQFHGEVFNITNGEPLTVRELTARVAKLLQLDVQFISVPLPILSGAASCFEFYAAHFSHREPALSKYGIESLGTTQTLSIEKAKIRLGYQPKISLTEAMKKIV